MAVYALVHPEKSILNFANDAAYDSVCANLELDDAEAERRYNANVQRGVNPMEFLDVAERGEDGQLTSVGIAAHFSRELGPNEEATVTYGWDFWHKDRDRLRQKAPEAPSSAPVTVRAATV